MIILSVTYPIYICICVFMNKIIVDDCIIDYGEKLYELNLSYIKYTYKIFYL